MPVITEKQTVAASPDSKTSWLSWTNAQLGLVAALLLSGLIRFFIFDASDPYKCGALLEDGRWLDDGFTNWQPNGCMLHKYQPKETTECLNDRTVVLVGDSTVRQMYYGMVQSVDPKVDTTGEKHSDKSMTVGGVRWDFVWDPFLNGTTTQSILEGRYRSGLDQDRPPALFVIGGGLWHLRHLIAEEAMVGWRVAVDRIVSAAAQSTPIADEVVLLPVERPIEARLSPDRRVTLRGEDIDAMNVAMEKIVQQHPQSQLQTLSIPYVFNKMLVWADSQTLDGLHFSEPIAQNQASVILNMRCNSAIPRKFPLSKTCCFQYPLPNPWQVLLLVLFIVGAPIGLRLLANSPTLGGHVPAANVRNALTAFGLSIGVIYLADRTPIWAKAGKQFLPAHFFGLSLIALTAGLATMSKPEKDLGFLNREQTDEWKGWMQVAILIYHYTGASKISPIYNPIRVLVAAYIFMSGYGHFFFYYKKADFGFARVFNVLVRLNLLPVVLAYTMDTDWLSYYFSPLITMWYLIIYLVMWIGHKWNSNLSFILGKLAISCAAIALFFHLGWPLEAVFGFSNTFLGTEWKAKEWTFRVALDLYIPYVGMLAALLVIKAGEMRIAEQPWWTRLKTLAIGASIVSMLGWIAFEQTQGKFVYNQWHPYISMFPVVAFAILRNAHPLLRSSHSKVFAYFGRISLETFIIQFHLWLAGDTQGLLVLIPGNGANTRVVNFVISSVVFIFVSAQVAAATGVLTEWICGSGKPSAAKRTPLVAPTTEAEYVPLATEDKEINGLLLQPASAKTRIPRLATWMADPRLRFASILGTLWILNLVYPSDVPISSHLLPTH